jgi:hypothetical protein
VADAGVRGAFRFGPFHLDVRDRRLSRGPEVIALRLKVFDTLRVLVENAGRLVTKQQLLETVWPETTVEENNLNHNVSLLRKVADGYQRWFRRFDRTLHDVFAIQDEIAEAVVASFRADDLSQRERAAMRRPQTTSEAYEYYLRARQHLPRMSHPDLGRARSRLRQPAGRSQVPEAAGAAEVRCEP